MAKRIVILGAGESGTGSAILALKKGFEVFVSDRGQIAEKYKEVLLHHEIAFEEGKHSLEIINQADEVIKSPGIPDHIPMIMELRNSGVPVISEIEFAGRYDNSYKIGITGSNGKTTTTLLTYEILKSAGLNVGLGGNVGKSYAWQIAEHTFDYFVLELSSFQLDGMYDFKLDIALLMNVTPDHLDRYGNSFQNYVNAKFRILQNMKKQDAFIFCQDDEIIRKEVLKRNPECRLYPFSLQQLHDTEGAWIENKRLIVNINSKILDMDLEKLALQGKHNAYNSMAAGVASRLIELRKDTVKQCLQNFENIEHRLEFVAKVRGVEFINDSKATNVNSCWYALESMNRPVVWIVGGVDKGNDYEQLKSLVNEKVKAIVCLGTDNTKIHEAFQNDIEVILDASSAKEAVDAAYYVSDPGDVVLLSPACASFDLFENYEDRGRQFKRAVRDL